MNQENTNHNNSKRDKLEQEIQEFVENHAVAENSEFTDGKKITEVRVLYPDDIEDENSRFYSDYFITPSNSEEMKELLTKAFKKLTREIIAELGVPLEKQKHRVIKRKVIYRVCPQMLCGDNPCSCKQENF